MKRTTTIKSATLLSILLSVTPLSIHPDALPLSNNMATQQAPDNLSMKDMFEGMSEDDLLMMVTQGQAVINDLLEHGTEEEINAFLQAMDETFSSFSPEELDEFNKMVKTVEEKLPASMFEPVTPIEPVKTEEKPKEKQKETIVAVDNSFENTLHAIEKSIKSILLKATSDKSLTEVINGSWSKKDAFLEMARLLQALNRKDLITKLTTSKDDELKKLVESIENFKTRIVSEDKKFVIADTFGLPTDEKTTKENISQLNKILEFFNSAIEPLTEKVTKFLKEYEPEALKKAKEVETQDKLALDHATKVEKMKKPASQVPAAQQGAQGGAPTNLNRNTPNYGGYNDYNPSAQDKRAANKEDSKKNSKDGSSSDDAKKAEEKKNENATFQTAKDEIEGYFDKYNAKDIAELNELISKTGSIYSPFNQEPTNLEEACKNLSLNTDPKEFAHILEKIQEQEQNKYMHEHAAQYNLDDVKQLIEDTINAENTALRTAALRGAPKGAKTEIDMARVAAIRQEKFSAAFNDDTKSTQADLDIVYKETQKKIIKHYHFHDHTKKAQAIYNEIAETITHVTPQITQLEATINTTLAALPKMTEQELTIIGNAKYCGELNQRAKLYKTTINGAKQALRSAHNKHALDSVNPEVRHQYADLGAKTDKVFELDTQINKIEAAMINLEKTIRSESAKRKRNANKVAAAAQ